MSYSPVSRIENGREAFAYAEGGEDGDQTPNEHSGGQENETGTDSQEKSEEKLLNALLLVTGKKEVFSE